MLIPLITDSGARIYQFLFSKSGNGSKTLNLTEEFLDDLPENFRDELSKAISEFIDPADTEITKFIFSYLDAYFVVSSSGLSPKVINKLGQLRDAPAEFVIFVDTNFIYSILGLHDNPSNEAAKDLMDLAKSVSSNVRIKFVVSTITLQETEQSIKNKRISLGNINYPPNLAEAVSTSRVSGVYKTFFDHVKISNEGINPSDFFSVYEKNLVRILLDKGIEVVSDEKINKYHSYPEVISDVNNQANFEQERYKNRAKSNSKIMNDVVLWYFVKDLRPNAKSLPIDAKYWIVTVDYRLLNFDKFKGGDLQLSPVCMLPAQLIQVLRFFSPRSIDFEKIMLSTMRFPLIVREYDPKIERVSVKIVKQLARYEGIEDLSVDTIQKVITDDGLNSKLYTGNLSESEEIDLINDSLIRQLTDYQQSIQGMKDEIKIQSSENLGLLEELRLLQERTVEANTETSYLKETIEKLRLHINEQSELLKEQSELFRKEKAREERKVAERNFIVLCFITILPYTVLLSFVWRLLVAIIQSKLLAYSLLGIVAVFVSMGLVSILSKTGKQNPYINANDIFSKVTSRLSWQAVLYALISLCGMILSSLFEEYIIRIFFP